MKYGIKTSGTQTLLDEKGGWLTAGETREYEI